MNASQISLHKVTDDDIPALISLEKSVAGTNIYSPMLDEKEWREEMEKGEVFLIKIGDEVVGNISYKEKSKDHLHISGLVVSPSFQGQGIARKVITDLVENFKEIERIDLVTHPENRRALNLYESLGFKVESCKEDYYGDGEPRLVLVLVRDENN